MSALITIDNATRTFGSGQNAVAALRGVSLTVEPGELVALVGPSGSGKSTLLLLAGGLDRADSGKVDVAGLDLAAARKRRVALHRRRHIGYVFQEYNLVPTLTAVENVALPLDLDGKGRAGRASAMQALAAVGLGDEADRFPEQLSGGQRQRVAIARAIVGDRRVLLADEPTGALDTSGSDAIMTLLRERADAGAAVLLSTHDVRATGWADRVVNLRDGQVLAPRNGSAAMSAIDEETAEQGSVR